MADVVVDAKITDPRELVQIATKAEILRDFNSAVTAYSSAIELIVTEHGDKHDSLGNIYLGYGRTLLEISREEAEPLGDAVPRELSSDSDSEGDNKENAEKEKGNQANSEKENKTDDEKKEEAEITNEASTDDQNNKPEHQNGETEPGVAGQQGEGEPSVSAAVEGESTEEKPEEEPTDLQLAWEVLELAKIIFEQRGTSGRRGLSETLVVLGEVSLESENFESAVTDIKAGLEIQLTVFKSDDRTLAETYYKLGVALSTNNQIDEAIENYNASLDVLNKRLARLKEDEVNQRDEIKEIETLIPDIQEKIADMKSYKQEATNKLVAAMISTPTTNIAFEAGSSDKKVSDITHLVKRKRKDDSKEEPEENPPTKKVSI